VKERIEVTKWTCDGCGDTELEDEDGETRGYFGDSVLLIDAYGGRGCVEWYACTDGCIRDAVTNAIQRANE
jgi:hypothetical protein